MGQVIKFGILLVLISFLFIPRGFQCTSYKSGDSCSRFDRLGFGERSGLGFHLWNPEFTGDDPQDTLVVGDESLKNTSTCWFESFFFMFSGDESHDPCSWSIGNVYSDAIFPFRGFIFLFVIGLFMVFGCVVACCSCGGAGSNKISSDYVLFVLGFDGVVQVRFPGNVRGSVDGHDVTVLDVKQNLCRQLRIPVAMQVLSFGNVHNLHDWRTIESYSIDSYGTIHLTSRLLGGRGRRKRNTSSEVVGTVELDESVFVADDYKCPHVFVGKTREFIVLNLARYYQEMLKNKRVGDLTAPFFYTQSILEFFSADVGRDKGKILTPLKNMNSTFFTEKSTEEQTHFLQAALGVSVITLLCYFYPSMVAVQKRKYQSALSKCTGSESTVDPFEPKFTRSQRKKVFSLQLKDSHLWDFCRQLILQNCAILSSKDGNWLSVSQETTRKETEETEETDFELAKQVVSSNRGRKRKKDERSKTPLFERHEQNSGETKKRKPKIRECEVCENCECVDCDGSCGVVDVGQNVVAGENGGDVVVGGFRPCEFCDETGCDGSSCGVVVGEQNSVVGGENVVGGGENVVGGENGGNVVVGFRPCEFCGETGCDGSCDVVVGEQNSVVGGENVVGGGGNVEVVKKDQKLTSPKRTKKLQKYSTVNAKEFRETMKNSKYPVDFTWRKDEKVSWIVWLPEKPREKLDELTKSFSKNSVDNVSLELRKICQYLEMGILQCDKRVERTKFSAKFKKYNGHLLGKDSIESTSDYLRVKFPMETDLEGYILAPFTSSKEWTQIGTVFYKNPSCFSSLCHMSRKQSRKDCCNLKIKVVLYSKKTETGQMNRGVIWIFGHHCPEWYPDVGTMSLNSKEKVFVIRNINREPGQIQTAYVNLAGSGRKKLRLKCIADFKNYIGNLTESKHSESANFKKAIRYSLESTDYPDVKFLPKVYVRNEETNAQELRDVRTLDSSSNYNMCWMNLPEIKKKANQICSFMGYDAMHKIFRLLDKREPEKTEEKEIVGEEEEEGEEEEGEEDFFQIGNSETEKEDVGEVLEIEKKVSDTRRSNFSNIKSRDVPVHIGTGQDEYFRSIPFLLWISKYHDNYAAKSMILTLRMVLLQEGVIKTEEEMKTLFIIDKDKRYIKAITELGFDYVLGVWHVNGAFSKKIKFSEGDDDRNSVFLDWKKTVYSSTEDQYQENKGRLIEYCSQDTEDYFEKHWEKDYEKWTFINRKKYGQCKTNMIPEAAFKQLLKHTERGTYKSWTDMAKSVPLFLDLKSFNSKNTKVQRNHVLQTRFLKTVSVFKNCESDPNCHVFVKREKEGMFGNEELFFEGRVLNSKKQVAFSKGKQRFGEVFSILRKTRVIQFHLEKHGLVDAEKKFKLFSDETKTEMKDIITEMTQAMKEDSTGDVLKNKADLTATFLKNLKNFSYEVNLKNWDCSCKDCSENGQSCYHLFLFSLVVIQNATGWAKAYFKNLKTYVDLLRLINTLLMTEEDKNGLAFSKVCFEIFTRFGALNASDAKEMSFFSMRRRVKVSMPHRLRRTFRLSQNQEYTVNLTRVYDN